MSIFSFLGVLGHHNIPGSDCRRTALNLHLYNVLPEQWCERNSSGDHLWESATASLHNSLYCRFEQSALLGGKKSH